VVDHKASRDLATFWCLLRIGLNWLFKAL
jgi:hypothetical protein